MTITNARLDAILVKHPALRPNHAFDEGSALHLCFGSWWWSKSETSARPVEDQEAHALIFRAMAEAIPREASLLRPWANQDGWRVTSDYAYRDKDTLKTYPTALEALCAYYESHAAKEETMK